MKYLTVMTFRDQMQRLERYLDRRMSDAKREEYYARLGTQCLDDIFHRAIDRLIDEHKTTYFPLVSEILEAYETERAGINYRESAHEPCEDCNGTGFVLRQDGEGFWWCSPCTCAKGQRILSGWKNRGIDRLVGYQNRRFAGRVITDGGDDSFDPEEFEKSPGPPAPAPVTEPKNPFDL